MKSRQARCEILPTLRWLNGGGEINPCPARGVYDISSNISKLWKDDNFSHDEEWNFGVGNV
jgi:hypothetical protein